MQCILYIILYINLIIIIIKIVSYFPNELRIQEIALNI